MKKKLTIGMATYDDYQGVFWTIQALRMYHAEVMDQVEIIVIDNNPDSDHGKEVRRFFEGYDTNSGSNVPGGRYIPFTEYQSAFVKGRVFEEAQTDFVLCLDCHVFLVPGAVRKLINYYDAFPKTKNLIQGPLIQDNLKDYLTHLKPEWTDQTFGTWTYDKELMEKGDPFEIPMNGCGLFSCVRENWVGFNPAFRGFGGEEWYIQEKFRKHGGVTLCLPFLQWMHRFQRMDQPEYTADMYDRIRNFIIGWMELYEDKEHEAVQGIVDNFVKHGFDGKRIRSFFDECPDNYL